MGVKTFLDSLYEDVGGLDAIPVNQIAATPAAVSPLLTLLQSAKPVTTPAATPVPVPVTAATPATTAPASAFPSSLAQLSALLAQPTPTTTATVAAKPTTTTTNPTPVAAPVVAAPVVAAPVATPTTAAAKPTTTTTAAQPVATPTTATTTTTAATPVAPAPVAAPAVPAPKVDYTSALAQQILGQGLTSKWSGEGFGSAEKNAEDMAKILAGIGITDIKQFGKITKTIPGYSYETEQGTVDVPEQTVTTYGNKVTGQEVPNTYSERQQGNFFGGTFAGKGNTGYGVQFDAQGNPIFYTQGASSNDLANIMKDLGPIGQIAIAAATGGLSLPAQLAANAGIQLLAGGNLGDIAKGTALSYLGGQAGNLISGSSGITDLLGKTGSDIASKATQQFVGSGGKTDIGQALLGGAINTGVNSAIGEVPGLNDLSATDRNLTSNLIAAVATGTPIEQAIQNALVNKASSEARSAVAEARNATPSAPAPQTYEEMMAGIEPKMSGPTTPDVGPSNDDILRQIGAEDLIKQPATVSQEPANVDELLRQLEPFKEKTTPGVNVAEQQAAEAKAAQEAKVAEEKSYQEQLAREAEARQLAIQKAKEEADAAQKAHEEQLATEARIAKERQDALDKAAAEAKLAEDAKALAKAKADQEEHDAQLAKEAQAAAERQAAIDRERAQAEADQRAYEEKVFREAQEAKDKQDAIDRANAEAKKQVLPEPTPEPKTVTELLSQIQLEPVVEPVATPVVMEPVVQPVAEEPVAPPTVSQEPVNIDELLRQLQTYAAPAEEAKTEFQEKPQITEDVVPKELPINIDNLLGQLPSQEQTTPAADNLINKAVEDTLGTKTENAAEPATGKDKAVDDIDFSQIPGDFGGSLADEITKSIIDTGNASSLFSGDGGLDIASMLYNNFNPDDYRDAFASGDLSQFLDPTQYADAYGSGENLMGSGRYESNPNTAEREAGFDYEKAKAAELAKAEKYDPTAALPEYGVQDLGISQKMIDEFNKNFNPAGGFGSQWQTVGTNKVMVNDDGTATVFDPTTNQSSYLTADQTTALIKNGTLNSSGSGYVGATGGKGTTPGGSKATTSTKTAPKPAAAGSNNNAGMLMALMAMMAMMNNKGSGGSSAASLIPALSANRSQLPYSPTGRPGAGGVNYFSPTTYTAKAAEGGLMGLAGGGMSDLGGYSDGGRLLKGPGDGVSDSIPATIGGKQPARLATGEFVVPARIVSELGNGSTDAGAKRLYEMMDRVQKKRRKTKNVAADTKAHKYLPS